MSAHAVTAPNSVLLSFLPDCDQPCMHVAVPPTHFLDVLHDSGAAFGRYVIAPDLTTLAALQTIMATHGHTLTVEQRAAVRGWLGRVG